MLAQGMKGNHETKIKKAISPEGGGARVGGTLKFQVTGMIEGLFWVWNFWFRNFLGDLI